MPDMESPEPPGEESPDLRIRVMSRAELDLAVDWAAAEGWNPGLADADCFHAADPQGFLVGLHENAPVASISVVRYGTFGFLGFYIVRAPFRGRGFGFRLWQAGMARLEGCTVGLDGVVAQQASYARSGFVLAHRNIRFGGTMDVETPADPRLTAIGPDLVDRVIAYDRAFFPAARDAFLQCWLRPDRRTGLALVGDGRLCGYGVIRACRTGHKVGPLFADTDADADILIRALASRAADGPVFVDVPEPNRAGIALAERYALKPAFETARMYRGTAPALPLDRIFGITTFELG